MSRLMNKPAPASERLYPCRPKLYLPQRGTPPSVGNDCWQFSFFILMSSLPTTRVGGKLAGG